MLLPTAEKHSVAADYLHDIYCVAGNPGIQTVGGWGVGLAFGRQRIGGISLYSQVVPAFVAGEKRTDSQSSK